MATENKYQKLALSLLFDAIGYLSFIIPGVTEMSDVVWAPVSAYLMIKMYKGNKGKVAAAAVFIEEAMPFMDVIPTFTLMWLNRYVFTGVKKENTPLETTIDI